jgi:hypothetical protein
MQTRTIYWLVDPVTKARVIGYPTQRSTANHVYQFGAVGDHLTTACPTCNKLHRYPEAVIPK